MTVKRAGVAPDGHLFMALPSGARLAWARAHDFPALRIEARVPLITSNGLEGRAMP